MDPRSRYAALVGAGTATALVVALALQVDTFFAPLLAFTAMQPHTLLSWRRLLHCAWTATVATVLTMTLGSALLQVPWLLLPCLFLLVSVVIYAIPLSSNMVQALAILPPALRTLYVGVFTPHQMGSIALSMWAAYLIGITTATIFGRVLSPAHPRADLAAHIATALAAARRRLRETAARFAAADSVPAPIPPPDTSALAERLQLLARARQEGMTASDERTLLALTTTAERIEAAVELADALARQPVGSTYRAALEVQIGALVTALDAALVGYEADARRLAAGAPPAPVPAWPDVLGALHTVEARQLELRRAGRLAALDLGEAAHVNGFVAQLRSLSYTLRISPQELERMAGGDPALPHARLPATTLRYDPYAARFALKCGLATVIAFQLPLIGGVDQLFSLIVAPFLVAQTSYGATIEKAPLRLLGVALGGVIAVVTMMAVMVNTDDVAAWAATVFWIIAGCAYLVLGTRRLSYVFNQVVVTFLFVSVAAGPATDVDLALWRVAGNFAGAIVIVAVFRLVAPDYAGRQLIARLHDLLGDVLALQPASDGGMPPVPHSVAVHRDIGLAVADLLRLVDEARLEGTAAGVDPTAAVEAAGLAQRIAYRSVAIARLHEEVERPPLPPTLTAPWTATREAVRGWVTTLRAVLAARHTTAHPQSRRFADAVAAAATAAAHPRPDAQRALRGLMDALDRERPTGLAAWPPAATGALFAELQHLQRIVDLLPTLDDQIVAMCGVHAPAPDAVAAELVPAPAV